MSLSKTLDTLHSTVSIQEDQPKCDCKIVDWDIGNLNKQNQFV